MYISVHELEEVADIQWPQSSLVCSFPLYLQDNLRRSRDLFRVGFRDDPELTY